MCPGFGPRFVPQGKRGRPASRQRLGRDRKGSSADAQQRWPEEARDLGRRADGSFLEGGPFSTSVFCGNVPRWEQMEIPPSTRARQTAEKILQAIYGDDFTG